jgi:tRNA modification GTPase
VTPGAAVIFALATAPGRSALAVIRISGAGSGEIIRAVAGPLPPPREARLRRMRGPGGETLDQGLAIWMPGPCSYTGEDSAELHLHGGAAVVDAVCDALLAAGARPAEPGEFTRRAFENGRLDLAQAEAVADLVDAESEGQRRQALAQLSGALSRRYEAWRETLLEALAGLEAAIDFPDEDLPEDVADHARPHLGRLEADLAAALAEAGRGERVREGFRIALIGAPNAGKSSLFNRLLGRDAAIVTAVPGTTRDVIEAPMRIAGFKALLADMAGLRAASEAIEAEGVRRARAWAEAAELRLWATDASAASGAWREAAELAQAGDILVLNKVDLGSGKDRGEVVAYAEGRGLEVLEASAVSEAGVEVLDARLQARVISALSGREFPAATRARHRARLEEALAAVGQARRDLDRGAELAAEDLRQADRALGRIAGHIDTEEVLGRIFSSFCIGK